MNDKLFIPQSVLDKWVEIGKVVFNDGVLTLVKEKKSYTLTSAVRFMKLVAGDDVLGLIGRLRSTDKLAKIKAEHMSDSVIVGDTAYEVQEGFIAIVLADSEVSTQAEQAAVQAVVPTPAPPDPVAAKQATQKPVEITATPATEGEGKDAELLTKFLLNNLNF